MAEETVTQETQVTEEPSTEPTLESVYEEFKVEPVQAQPKPQQKEQPKQEQKEVIVPDPALDPEGHRAFMRTQVEQAQQFKGALTAVAQHLQKHEHERATAAEEADIKKAVEIVNSQLKADPDFAEIAIAQRAKKDPKFLALWQNRKENPAALEKGLKALASELSKKFEFRVDPQLTENQRAMKEVTSTKAVGAAPDSMTERLAKATGREFEQLLESVRHSGG